MDKYRILIADDHGLFREGLRKILAAKCEIEVVGEAADSREVLNLFHILASKDRTPQILILDISMPGLPGIEIIQDLKATYPEVKILMLTMHKDKEHFYRSVSAGADGYLIKDVPETELFSAIDKIKQGKKYVSSCISKELTESLDSIWDSFQKPPLTPRELEVLRLIADGKSNKEIGVLLSISVHTVENHRANIMNKLGLRSTASLTKYVIDKGYL